MPRLVEALERHWERQWRAAGSAIGAPGPKASSVNESGSLRDSQGTRCLGRLADSWPDLEIQPFGKAADDRQRGFHPDAFLGEQPMRIVKAAHRFAPDGHDHV